MTAWSAQFDTRLPYRLAVVTARIQVAKDQTFIPNGTLPTLCLSIALATQTAWN
jgi:hypothetical protein